MSFKLIWFAASVFPMLIGLLITMDSSRFSRHIALAQILIAQGVPEAEAMERSGCNHWNRWFLLRIWKEYPPLPN